MEFYWANSWKIEKRAEMIIVMNSELIEHGCRTMIHDLIRIAMLVKLKGKAAHWELNRWCTKPAEHGLSYEEPHIPSAAHAPHCEKLISATSDVQNQPPHVAGPWAIVWQPVNRTIRKHCGRIRKDVSTDEASKQLITICDHVRRPFSSGAVTTTRIQSGAYHDRRPKLASL